ncbi:hypothetical protein CNR22_00045 [Sphingobacteriaceae bacterium]|nr:hypothetical protein CNR22_00045 [Sphingobacteriaceae bacterium]
MLWRVTAATTNTIYGTYGNAVGSGSLGFSMGAFGSASGGQYNHGGYFQASGTSLSNNYGVIASVSGGAFALAGYFIGDVSRTGTDNFTSDRKLKENIRPLENALDKILQLKPSSYTFKTTEYKDMNLPAGKQMGLIAQELEQVFPELVKNIAAINLPGKAGEEQKNIPEYKAVQYVSLIPVLIAAIQEQQAQIEELKKGNATTGITTAVNADNVFSMSQNEPNPFNSETKINYVLPVKNKEAYLAVYDLTGKQVTSFFLTEKGSASIILTSEKLAAGIYIYSIIADGKVMDSKKMIVAGK